MKSLKPASKESDNILGIATATYKIVSQGTKVSFDPVSKEEPAKAPAEPKNTEPINKEEPTIAPSMKFQISTSKTVSFIISDHDMWNLIGFECGEVVNNNVITWSNADLRMVGNLGQIWGLYPSKQYRAKLVYRTNNGVKYSNEVAFETKAN